jgi:hemerythrin-like domain-containing protein
MKEAEAAMEKARTKKRAVAGQMKQAMFETNELEMEGKALHTKYMSQVDQLEKSESSYPTLRRLKQALQDKGI